MNNAGHASLADRASHGDYEAAAALTILECPFFATDARAWRHVDVEGINWAAILSQGTWSSGERRLLELGRALWKGDGPVDVVYLFTALGEGSLQIVVDAIVARRGYRRLPDPTLAVL